MRIVSTGEAPLWAAGMPARVIGWGSSVFLVGPGSDDLQEVDVPMVSDADCDTSYNALSPFVFDPDTMVCAGETTGGKDSCQGDSGGPLVVKDAIGAWTQVGVVSFGLGCGFPLYYGVYARIGGPVLNGWLASHLPAEGAPPAPPGTPSQPTTTSPPTTAAATSTRISFRRALGSARKVRRARTVRLSRQQPHEDPPHPRDACCAAAASWPRAPQHAQGDGAAAAEGPPRARARRRRARAHPRDRRERPHGRPAPASRASRAESPAARPGSAADMAVGTSSPSPISRRR